MSDLERSIRFYTDCMGLKVIRRFRADSTKTAQVLVYEQVDVKGALLEISDGSILELLEYIEPNTAARQITERHVISSAHVAMLVEDIDDVLARLVVFGGTRHNDPAETEPGKILSYAQDPDGNWLESMEFSG